jgi:hypothetical protein
MRPVASLGRKSNESYRVREHLTEAEVSKLLKALKANRHGHRDWLIGLISLFFPLVLQRQLYIRQCYSLDYNEG